MAFTKKFVKSKKEAPKAAASYARKKRQEEEEVVEEVEEVEAEAEEVQDDYDSQEETEPAPRRNAQAPASRQAPRQAPRQSFGGQGEQKKALRLTGLFAGKREGCYSGKLRDEDADNLAALIEEAKATGQQVVFFVWENQGNPQFSLTANISAPFQKGGGRGFNRGGNGGGFNRGSSGGFRRSW